jgi:DNA-binding transcriptional LysR family regulator
MTMELRHLRYFVAVAEEEHIGRAAEHLEVAQPAVTRTVQQLERELGVTLLERRGRSVRLTATGRVFLTHARQALAEAEHAVRQARLAQSGRAGTLNVGFVETATYSGVLPAIFREFRARTPEVQLELHALNSVEQWRALDRETLDVGFVYYRPPDSQRLEWRAITTDRVVLAVPSEHKLARAPRVRLRDLRTEPFIWIPRSVSPGYYDAISEPLRRAGVELNVVQEAGRESTLLSLVSGGVGLSFVVAATRSRQPRDVVLRPVPDLNVTLSVEVVWRRNTSSPVVAQFIDVARSVATRRRPLPRRRP